MHKMQIMGIVNVTSDSFYSGLRNLSLEGAYHIAKKQMNEGADWLDIGGESTRPGALPVSEEEELTRVLPVISACVKECGIPISVDTYKVAVARAAIQAGARMVNDVRGGENLEMRQLIAETGVDVVLMHMQGSPQTMQKAPNYPEGVVKSVLNWFKERIELFISLGVPKEKIWLDPGIGFGKTVLQNIELLEHLPQFRQLGARILIGISRKSFLAAHTGSPPTRLPEHRLTETIAMQTLLMSHPLIADSIDCIRVHDVGEHVALRSLLQYLSHIQPSLLHMREQKAGVA